MKEMSFRFKLKGQVGSSSKQRKAKEPCLFALQGSETTKSNHQKEQVCQRQA